MAYELYLAHHGRKNQRWGVRHGPPYPLERGAFNGAPASVERSKMAEAATSVARTAGKKVYKTVEDEIEKKLYKTVISGAKQVAVPLAISGGKKAAVMLASTSPAIAAGGAAVVGIAAVSALGYIYIKKSLDEKKRQKVTDESVRRRASRGKRHMEQLGFN